MSVTVYETRDFVPNVSREVGGVVEDVRELSLPDEAVPAIYIPHAQETDPGRRWSMVLVARTMGDPTSFADLARGAVREVDENLAVEALQTMERVVRSTVVGPRFRTVLVLIFSGISLLLATIGVAGVVGYAVSQRRQEFGMRMALGAERKHIGAIVVAQGSKLVVLGLVLGLAASLVMARVLESLP
jgi:ABC-type antimicrobial peptide transport system permease subunit